MTMPTIRCFPANVEAVAPVWRAETLTTLPWSSPGNPGEAGGQAQGFFVKSGDLTGFAKPSRQPNEPADAPPRAVHEKIASDLAFDLRLPIPPVVLWRRNVSTPDQETLCAVSLVPFNPAHKWQHVEVTPVARDRIATALAAAASAMSVCDTWLDNRDRHNGGNLLVHEQLTTGNIHWAYIDYAYSMTYGWGQSAAPATAAVVGRYPGHAALDMGAVADALRAIETMEESEIQSVPTRLSPDFLDSVRAAIIADGLIRRRTGLREAGREYGGGL
jgi:hypothetical protein